MRQFAQKIGYDLTSISRPFDSVPDPYNSGSAGFEQILDILEDGCDGLIRKLHS